MTGDRIAMLDNLYPPVRAVLSAITDTKHIVVQIRLALFSGDGIPPPPRHFADIYYVMRVRKMVKLRYGHVLVMLSSGFD